MNGEVLDSESHRRTPGSHVEVLAVRHLKGIRGNLLVPVSARSSRRDVAMQLRHFLSVIEESEH